MKRVLVVDDSLTIRMYIKHLLSTLVDLEIVEAENGLEGLEKAYAHQFDLLIVDVNMPNMDGYAFLQAVREQQDLQCIPAIMATTESQSHDIEKAYASGANVHLAKPFYPESFHNIVTLLLGGIHG